MEEYIWRKSGDLTEKDQENFLALFGKFRNRSGMDSLFWKMDYGSYLELMEEAKGSDFKLRFLKQWYRRKLAEHKERTSFPDGKFALPDKQIFEYRKQEIRERSKDIFEEWSGMKVEEISTEKIPFLLELLKKELKISSDLRTLELVRIVFFHPALQGRAWEELYAIINNQGLEVYEGSYLFTKPIPVRGDKLQAEISKEEWVKRVENASVNFLPDLIKKFMV